MLFESLFLHRILKNKRNEDLRTSVSRWLLNRSHHHFLNRCHKIIKVCALEPPKQDCFKTGENACLSTVISNVGFDYLNESFNLYLWKVVVHTVCSDKLSCAFEQAVNKLIVSTRVSIEKFKNAVYELSEKSFEWRQTQMNNMNHNLEGLNYNRIVKRFERVEKWLYKWIKH